MSLVSRQSWSADDEVSIPDDLWIEILHRLPPERAVECRQLSKFYRAVIERDDFIRKNYDRSIKTTPSFLLRSKSGTEFLVDFDPTKSAATVRQFTKPYVNDKDVDPPRRFVGCCRGILCYNTVKGRPTRLAFWNPFTGAYRRSSAEHVGPSNWKQSLLGYDAVTDDLKVLKIMKYKDLGGNKVYAYAVYSSNTDSWRRVEGLKDEVIFGPVWGSMVAGQVFLEGTNCVHILVSLRLDNTLVILCFDFASEKFNLVSVPKHWPIKSWDGNGGLSSLNGCLCIHHPHTGDVWMMKQYGDEESWARVFYLNGWCSLNLIPLTCVNEGRQLLVLSSSSKPQRRLWLCDAEEGKLIHAVLHAVQVQPPDMFQNFDALHFLFAATLRQP